MSVMEATTALAKIKALYAGLDDLNKQLGAVVDETRFPWREYEEPEVDERQGIKNAMEEIEQEIIYLEREYVRDPMQDAEMRYEIECAIAFSGNRNDDASLYLHTPLEELRFQEMIEDQVKYGYYDESGWNDGICGDRYWREPCSLCNTITDEDGIVCVNGWDTCQEGCTVEAHVWFYLLSFITGTEVEMCSEWADLGSLDREVQFKSSDDE